MVRGYQADCGHGSSQGQRCDYGRGHSPGRGRGAHQSYGRGGHQQQVNYEQNMCGNCGNPH